MKPDDAGGHIGYIRGMKLNAIECSEIGLTLKVAGCQACQVYLG